MTVGASLLPAPLRADIEAAITDSAVSWDAHVEANREARGGWPLAVKYVPARYAAQALASAGLAIGESNYTWGRGVYVTGVEEPLSTAIYGRAGLVARFHPVGWRAFDARVPDHQALYLRWLQAQPDYEDAVLTVHSDHFLHRLRNTFREQFHIDVVLFHPDERDSEGWYTSRDHIWLAVSHWSGDRLARGTSDVFKQIRLTLLPEEEFDQDPGALVRRPLLALSAGAPPPPSGAVTWPEAVRDAYAAANIVRVPA
jgi:hypothetical protein